VRLAVLLAALTVALLAGSASADGATFFRTPSGNIGCVYDARGGGTLRCDIRSGLKPSPAKPKGCTVDWGDSLTLLRQGRARITCHGDTVFQQGARVLRYGTTWRRQGFRCTSRTSGLTCRNPSGKGFFLSRERWQRVS
jgi:hypothetical protein